MEFISPIIQIIILWFSIYAILKRAKGSRFGQALMGVGILVTILALFTYLLNFTVLAALIKYLLIYFAISSVVIFQPEIRRFLATIGALGNFDRQSQSYDNDKLTPESFTEIIKELSIKKMGALFAFERGISLRGYEETGVRLDAVISPELIVTIFTPPLPLHDGGAIIRNGRLASAHCLFPVSHNSALARNGMRHRAMVGISEETDAVSIMVSEETGNICVAYKGKLVTFKQDCDPAIIMRWVRKAIPDDSSESNFFPKQIKSLKKFWNNILQGIEK
ncbi:MAG: diadenylate cyclase CdaA [Kiritimatiellae bacterium]|nr:diadenylate cyclase CdaA [Kiritimatiellia bacterium]MBR3777565.1 diadenylate cyclase CdaA [Kiritimatiellia bacterium]